MLPEQPRQPDLAAIQARVDELTSDDWSGYTDDLGDNAGPCELFAGPWVNGYRTGSVFAVVPDCDCGCYPPSPAEMHFIWRARSDIPMLVAEVCRLRADLDAVRAAHSDDWQNGYDTGCAMSHSIGCGAVADHRDALLVELERTQGDLGVAIREATLARAEPSTGGMDGAGR